MPKTKFQEVVFTILMVFVMVYAMICYNIALNIGGMRSFYQLFMNWLLWDRLHLYWISLL